ncbi:MAG: histidine phosphatase family protein [bacterium]|nr:histidine phosphatase family protein [bacterium]
MTNIYIIRHAETDSNIRHACLGHKDVPLNENGIKQAETLAEKLKDIKLDVVYSSPLNRAIETINPPAARGPGVPVIMSFALIERDFGIWDDMTFDEIKAQYPAEFKAWQEDWTGYKIPGGESSEEVQNRINLFMQKLIDSHRNQNIAVVTHLGTARHIISYLLGLSVEQSRLFTLDNAGYAVIGIDDDNRPVLKGLNI